MNNYWREIRKLAVAIALLSDAIDWLDAHKPSCGATFGARGKGLIDSLPDGYGEAFTANLADKRNLRAIKRTATTKGLRHHLACWIDVFHRLVCEEANRFNRKRQRKSLKSYKVCSFSVKDMALSLGILADKVRLLSPDDEKEARGKE